MRPAMRSSVRSGKFAVFDEQHFDSSIDQIRWVLHRLGGDDIACAEICRACFPWLPSSRLQRPIIAVESCWRDIGYQVVRQLHFFCADMTDYRSGNALRVRKIVEALIDFQQNHERKLLG